MAVFFDNEFKLGAQYGPYGYDLYRFHFLGGKNIIESIAQIISATTTFFISSTCE